MKGKLENEGKYELFQTTNGNQILNLNDTQYFAVVQGQKGEILVATDSDHQKEKTLKKGKFYLAAFKNDPVFNDVPHLFLQEGNKYREWILPNDKPGGKDYQKKLIKTDNLIGRGKLEGYIKNPGSEKQGGDLKTMSKQELMDIAKKRNIRGRSKMKKEQLIEELK